LISTIAKVKRGGGGGYLIEKIKRGDLLRYQKMGVVVVVDFIDYAILVSTYIFYMYKRRKSQRRRRKGTSQAESLLVSLTPQSRSCMNKSIDEGGSSSVALLLLLLPPPT